MARPSPSIAESPGARIPYAFSRAHGVLAWRVDGDAIVVLLRPDATVEGIAELRRVTERNVAGVRQTRSSSGDLLRYAEALTAVVDDLTKKPH